MWHFLITCPSCEPVLAARTMLVHDHFGTRAVLVASPIVAVILVIAAAARFVDRLTLAGILLGSGLGGFVDGIVLHQILQWHDMLSSIVPPTDLVSMKYNMIWDGIFHVATWVLTFAGVLVLAHTKELKPQKLWGGMLAGWGIFNIVEGTVDHIVLGIHHLHPGDGQVAWDIAFVGLGAFLLAAGRWLGRFSQRCAVSA